MHDIAYIHIVYIAVHYTLIMVFVVYQRNVTLYDSEQSLLQGNQNLTDAMICVWNGGLVPRSEWLFLGNNIISPLAMTNSSWDMEQLLCMVESDCELQQCGEVFTIQGIYHYRYILLECAILPSYM